MRILLRCTALLLLGLAADKAQAAIPQSNQPLFLSTSVSPNVMLLFDNSGSMLNMTWASAYNPSTTYADWAPRTCGNNDNTRCWLPTDGNVGMDSIEAGSCSSSRRAGRLNGSGTTKCLLLPTPDGTDTRYTGNYLNYLFATYATNTNLTTGTIPTVSRLTAAKDVATTLVTANPSLRWGLARFNPPISGGDQGPGGKVVAACGSTQATVTNAISGLSADSNTPLAETFYEVTRYFRGLSSQYNSSTSYTSPVQYRCQKNFVIVVTDGFPTYDSTFPANDPDDVANSFVALPNWDAKAPSTTSTTYPFFPRYSDGFRGQSGTTEGLEAWSLYLDDLAKFGYDTDLKKSGTDLTGASYEDSNFKIQRIQTYSVGLAINNQMLQDAAEYGLGKSYSANNATQLQSVLQAALNDIASRTSAAASIATNSTRLTADTSIYQARFATGDWSGQLLALPVNLDGTVGTPLWDAANRVPAAASRNILTYDPTLAVRNRGRGFLWAQLNSTQTAALNKDGGRCHRQPRYHAPGLAPRRSQQRRRSHRQLPQAQRDHRTRRHRQFRSGLRRQSGLRLQPSGRHRRLFVHHIPRFIGVSEPAADALRRRQRRHAARLQGGQRRRADGLRAERRVRRPEPAHVADLQRQPSLSGRRLGAGARCPRR